MRFLSCYIAGFGKFADRSFDLSNNIVVIREENGWGKTTLAAFLESMLYGLDGGRSKAVADNDRIRYQPFSGGAFGGALVFTYGGKTYRVERSFARTAGGDSVRVYDGNNMPCYLFGDKAERLGETVTGVSRESYRKSAYIPQGGISSTGLPDDMKGRLIALLSADGKKENGAQTAIDRLDAAERALRAKRRPAKGKLDEIDERLTALAREKADCKTAAETAAALRAREREYAARLSALSEKAETLSKALLDGARQEARQADEQAYRQLRLGAETARNTLGELNAFFGGVEPNTVNTDGLQNAVTEFYRLKEEISKEEEWLYAAAADSREAAALAAQLAAVEKTAASYEQLINAEREKERAGKRLKDEKRKGARKKRRGGTFWICVFLAAAIVGAVLVPSLPAVGYLLLAAGGGGLLVKLVAVLRIPSGGRRKGSDTSGLTEEYENAQREAAALRAKLAALPSGDADATKETELALARKRERAAALEGAIKNFLGNFRFEETYDYRAALKTLRENIARHARCLSELQNYNDGAERLEPQETPTAFSDMPALRAQKAAIEREKEDLTAERARLCERIKANEEQALGLTELNGEEERLSEEKARLEKRLTAIRSARELLVRARENMATRYLLPVEKSCREYLREMGFARGGEGLRFSADGAPVFEENGNFRAFDYYSAGLKDLTDLCMRIALAERIFVGEPPVLVLDDPFTELDDDKTERAKRLLVKLSEKYQIVYFTCKRERSL